MSELNGTGAAAPFERLRQELDDRENGTSPGSHSQDSQDLQDEWSKPIPLGAMPKVSPFPVDVLPEAMRHLCNEIAEAMNVPPDFPATVMLNLAGGAIGNSRRVSITPSHSQPAITNIGIIGLPGTTKTAVLKALRGPFDQEHRRRQTKWKQELTAWEKEEKEERKAKPSLSRCIVDDITTESLCLILGENLRGLAMVKPELAALITSMNQYKQGKGQDRQVYLKLWDGETILTDRKSDKSRGGAPIYAPDPFCSIVGTIQPDTVKSFRSGNDDGFLDRWLYCYPDPLPVIGETWKSVSLGALSGWKSLIDLLLGLKMERQSDSNDPLNEYERPFYVNLAPSGRLAWEGFTNQHAKEMNASDFHGHLRGPWSKLRAYVARFSLILHFMWQLTESTGEGHGKKIDEDSMWRAISVVEYFKSHLKRVYSVMDADSRTAQAKRLLAWIEREKPSEFKRWQAYEDVRSDSHFPTQESVNIGQEVGQNVGQDLR